MNHFMKERFGPAFASGSRGDMSGWIFLIRVELVWTAKYGIDSLAVVMPPR
jgi:hypothetical protein